jgi:hypothetical protein
VSKRANFRLTCSLCDHEWIGEPYYEQDDYIERCPECNSEEFEIGKEYRPFRIESFWIVLLILECLFSLPRNAGESLSQSRAVVSHTAASITNNSGSFRAGTF